jgi:dipeptidyl aminopeptidase/acylaminoacyl peptidase
MRIRKAILALAALALATTALAADKERLTPQRLWSMKRLGSPALSPDGKLAAFTVQEWSIEKNKSTTNLWLVDLATGATRRLTAAPVTDGAPEWDPEGRRLAFTSKRGEDENASLYVMAIDGGEPQKVLELPFAISGPKWMPDGKSLVVTTTVIPELAGTLAKADLAAMKKEIKRRKDAKMTARVTEDRQYRYFDHYLTDGLANRLLLVDVASKEWKDLTPKYGRLFTNSGEFTYEIAPDGKNVAITLNSTPPPYRELLNNDIYLVRTDGSGGMKNLTPENPGDDSSPVFAPDGQSLVFARTTTPYYSGESRKLWRHEFTTEKNVPLTVGLDYSIDEARFSDDGKALWVTAEERGFVPVFKLGADGAGLTPVQKTGTSTGLVVRGGNVVFLNDETSRPNELFVLRGGIGPARQVTHFNDEAVARLDLGKVESYWFKGAAGDDIHGWLVYPPGYDPKKTYPLVELMHGGPHTMNRDSWSYRWNTHVLASPGYIVTWVNRHGSTGFGEKFARSILNQWGEMPFEDIMKSADVLLARFPSIDKTKLAAAGASYGGYMAAWVLGHTDRFQCIIDHAGVNDSYSQFATDVPHGFAKVMGGTPWENVEGFQRENPMFYAKSFKTPTLILHGEMDYRVPYGNGLELYGVLQALGVPSRLVVFPNENHWVLSPQNAIYWHYEMQAWLARFIGGKPMEKPVFESEAN